MNREISILQQKYIRIQQSTVSISSITVRSPVQQFHFNKEYTSARLYAYLIHSHLMLSRMNSFILPYNKYKKGI